KKQAAVTDNLRKETGSNTTQSERGDGSQLSTKSGQDGTSFSFQYKQETLKDEKDQVPGVRFTLGRAQRMTVPDSSLRGLTEGFQFNRALPAGNSGDVLSQSVTPATPQAAEFKMLNRSPESAQTLPAQPNTAAGANAAQSSSDAFRSNPIAPDAVQALANIN